MGTGRRLEEGRFDGAGPDLVHKPTGFRVWLTRPVGMITQVGDATMADETVADFLSVTGHAELERRRGGGKAVYLHDWRRLTGYTPKARRIMTEWALAVRPSTERIVIALSPQAKVVRMGVAVATLALQVAGFTVEVVDELQPVIDRLGVHR